MAFAGLAVGASCFSAPSCLKALEKAIKAGQGVRSTVSSGGVNGDGVPSGASARSAGQPSRDPFRVNGLLMRRTQGRRGRANPGLRDGIPSGLWVGGRDSPSRTAPGFGNPGCGRGRACTRSADFPVGRPYDGWQGPFRCVRRMVVGRRCRAALIGPPRTWDGGGRGRTMALGGNLIWAEQQLGPTGQAVGRRCRAARIGPPRARMERSEPRR